MIAEYLELFGEVPPSGYVPRQWLDSNRIAEATVRADAPLIEADDLEVRQRFEASHARLLLEHGMERFDISAIRSRTRPVTQAFSHWAHENGHAGVCFRSNVDDEECAALFEERAHLAAARDSVPVEESSVLQKVVEQLGLTVEA